MPIASLCSKKPVFIKKGASIRDAAQLMKEKNIGSLIVTSGNGSLNPVGLVTDRDIAVKVFSKGLTGDTPIEKIMSKQIVSTHSDAGIAEVIDKMERNGVRRIVVKNKGEEIFGMVSFDDILQLVARELYGIGRLVQKQTETKSKSGRKSAEFDSSSYQ